MLPLSNRVMALNRLIDQVIANVDKHEDQIDIIEQALFGRSRHMNEEQLKERAENTSVMQYLKTR